jgi:putative ABC transport system ATP-binding protein
MPNSNTLIRLQNVAYRYREGGRERAVLKGVRSEIRRGEYVALLGQSGSGKTTLLNLIAGLDLPQAGEVSVDGVALNRLSEKERTLFRRRRVGFVYQFFNLLPTLSVAENILLPLELIGAPAMREVALNLLREVGLAERADSFPDQLSGGEQQRVAVLRALAHDPVLLLADEPTGNLDSESGEQVLALFDRLIHGRGRTLLVATHNLEVAARADRILYLRDGQLTEEPP